MFQTQFLKDIVTVKPESMLAYFEIKQIFSIKALFFFYWMEDSQLWNTASCFQDGFFKFYKVTPIQYFGLS